MIRIDQIDDVDSFKCKGPPQRLPPPPSLLLLQVQVQSTCVTKGSELLDVIPLSLTNQTSSSLLELHSGCDCDLEDLITLSNSSHPWYTVLIGDHHLTLLFSFVPLYSCILNRDDSQSRVSPRAFSPLESSTSMLSFIVCLFRHVHCHCSRFRP
jgi:hypothetical protein